MVSIKRSQTVWVLKDGFPKLNPENQPLEKVEHFTDAGSYGTSKHTNRVIVTDPKTIAFRSDLVDTRSPKREFHFQWDFTIRFKETVTGAIPSVLEPDKHIPSRSPPTE